MKASNKYYAGTRAWLISSRQGYLDLQACYLPSHARIKLSQSLFQTFSPLTFFSNYYTPRINNYRPNINIQITSNTSGPSTASNLMQHQQAQAPGAYGQADKAHSNSIPNQAQQTMPRFSNRPTLSTNTLYDKNCKWKATQKMTQN